MDRHKDLRLLSFTCVMIAVWCVSEHYLGGSLIVRGVAAVAWVVAYVRVGKTIRLPKWLAVILVLLAMGGLVAAVPVFHMSPGAALAYFLIGSILIKCFGIQRLNDYNELMMLVVLSMLAAGALQRDAAYFLLLIVFFPLAGLWLYRSHLVAEWQSHRQHYDQAGLGLIVADRRRSYLTGFVWTAIWCSLLALVLYLLVPKRAPALPYLSLGAANQSSQTGLSNELMLGEMSQILKDKTPVLRVKMQPEDQNSYSPQLYLRGAVSDAYVLKGDRWRWVEREAELRVETLQTTMLSKPTAIQPSLRPPTSGVYWRFYYQQEQTQTANLFVVDRPTAIAANESMQLTWCPSTNTLRASQAPRKGFCYELLTEQPLGREGAWQPPTSAAPKAIQPAPTTQVARPALRASMRPAGQAVAYAGQEFQSRTVDLSSFRKLGDDIIASMQPTTTATTQPTSAPTSMASTTAPTSAVATSDIERVHRFQSYLRKDFSYTLDNRDEDATLEPVMNFLLSRKRGHCEYFASALVLLCQAQGMPARVVIGFKGGEYNTFGNYYLIRNCDAHAWSEVYIRDTGWMRFDPTPPARDTMNIERESGFKKLFWDVVDLMRFSWITRVTTTGGDGERRKFINRVRDQLNKKDKPGTPEGPTLRERLEKIYNFIRGEGYQNSLPQVLHWVLVVLVVMLTICVVKIGILGCEKLRLGIHEILYRRRLMRFGAAWQCPVDFYRKTLITLAGYGMVRASTQTAEEFAEFVGSQHECVRDEFDAITREYLEVRFGGHGISEDDRRVVSLAMQTLATRLHEKHRPEEELAELKK